MNVNFRNIAQGAYSEYQTANEMVIDNPEEWASVWQQHASGIIPPPPIPKVDFTDYQIVAVFMGEKHTGGYSVEILTVETESSETDDPTSVVIQVNYRQPQPGDIVQEVITHPHHIIRIPQIPFVQIVFEQV